MESLVKFLLAEDDEQHARLVMRSLEINRIQNRVDHVKDGDEAIQYLLKKGKFSNTETPDVILLDLKLPKYDGHELIEFIKSNPQLKSIPVIMMTTSDSEVDREKAYQNNVNSYLVKPIDFTKFKKMVDDLCLYWGIWNRGPVQSSNEGIIEK